MKTTVYLHTSRDYADQLQIMAFSQDMSDCSHSDYILIGTKEVEIDLPDDMTALEIAHLERKADRIKTATREELGHIEERIESLRCLTYQPA